MVIDLPLTSWLPDSAALNNPGLVLAKNCTASIGLANGQVTYNPVNRAKLFSSSVLPEPPLGVYVGSDKLKTTHVFAGTQSALHKFDTSSRTWKNVSRSSSPYSTTAEEAWNFIQYGGAAIATNYNDYPQLMVMDLGLRFDNLTTLVRGRHIAQHRGFVLLADTYDSLDGAVPNRVRWSALDNPYAWDFSASSQADFQDVQDVGAINGIVVDEDVWLLCEEAIMRMHYIGTPWIYQFENAINGKGCAFSKSVVSVDGVTYFLDDDGFYSFQKGQLKPVGLGKVNDTFFKMFDTANASRMTAVVDPNKTLIYWTFVSVSSTNAEPDTVFAYNYVTGDWTIIEATVPFLYPAKTLSWTIDQLDVFGSFENVPASFDSPLWAGGGSIIWGMDFQGRVYTLTGEPLVAEFKTKEMQLTQGSGKMDVDMAVIMGVRPIFENTGTASVAVGSKDLPNGFIDVGNHAPTHPKTGWSYHRKRARYHQIDLKLEGGWDKASALQIDFIPSGGR